MDSKLKRIGTREAVYKGLATQTAGGLKKEDIIEKHFGVKIIYISKKLSNKMRDNFNIIRANNPNHLKRNIKRTMMHKPNECETSNPLTTNLQMQSQPQSQPQSQQKQQSQPQQGQQSRLKHNRTQKLSFKIKENMIKNVYYPELQGMDIKQLKEELVKEENEEDIEDSGRSHTSVNNEPKIFSIEDMPDIDMSLLE